MLEPLYTSDEMRAAEAGHDVATLMERAGRAVAEEALHSFPRRAAFRAVRGRRRERRRRQDRRAHPARSTASTQVEDGADLVIDALLGTGMRGAPRDDAAATIERINASGAPVLAVDIPSGVNASTGEVEGAAVDADVTVTMHGRKVGLVVGPGRFHAGDVIVADIGLEPRETAHRLVTRDILERVPRRRDPDNKYSAGSVLVVGGARGTTGAAALAARAAFRADAGYVAIAAPADALPTLETLVARGGQAAARGRRRRRRARVRARARPRPRTRPAAARAHAARGDAAAGGRRRRRAATSSSRSSATRRRC